MKTFRAKTGPFAEQPFYEPAEIESICSDELRKLNLYPSDPARIRIDRFIEKRFGVQPKYEDLPAGLLGFTRFGTKGVEEIVDGMVLHELLHNLGFSDMDLQASLNVIDPINTDSISVELTKDCFPTN
jgi:hypothetical protein